VIAVQNADLNPCVVNWPWAITIGVPESAYS
jgi:hypothetical protein